MPTEIQTIEIGCSSEELYDYIRQPWRWHEWHPNSKGAQASVDKLEVGDTFEESFEIRVLSFLPVTLRRTLHWTVIEARPPSYWEIHATTKDGSIRFRYEFKPSPGGVRFTRSLDYEMTGITQLLEPLLRRRNAKMSAAAVTNLAKRMEAGAHLDPQNRQTTTTSA